MSAMWEQEGEGSNRNPWHRDLTDTEILRGEWRLREPNPVPSYHRQGTDE